MRTDECVSLIADGVRPGGGVWADLGSGGGAFTAALAGILGPGSTIWTVDTDRRLLDAQVRALSARYRGVNLRPLAADFTAELRLPPLDGVVMANSLHFQLDACAVLRRVSRLIRAGGTVVVVEYDIDRPNPWVPYPLPLSRLQQAAECAGLSAPRFLGARPSRYHRRMYAAACSAGSGDAAQPPQHRGDRPERIA